MLSAHIRCASLNGTPTTTQTQVKQTQTPTEQSINQAYFAGNLELLRDSVFKHAACMHRSAIYNTDRGQNTMLAIATWQAVQRALPAPFYKGNEPLAPYNPDKLPLSSYVNVVAASKHKDLTKAAWCVDRSGNNVPRGSRETASDESHLEQSSFAARETNGRAIDTRPLYRGSVEAQRINQLSYEQFAATLPEDLRIVLKRCEITGRLINQDRTAFSQILDAAQQWGTNPRRPDVTPATRRKRQTPKGHTFADVHRAFAAGSRWISKPPTRASVENTFPGLVDAEN